MKLLKNAFAVLGLGVIMVVSCGSYVSSQFADIRAATVSLHTKGSADSFCSGVMVAPGYMLTAAHCAEVADILVGADRIPAGVLKMDKDNDLALMHVERDCPCVPVAAAAPEIDEEVFVVGFPQNDPVAVQVLTEGRVQGEAGSVLSPRGRAMRITAPIWYGNSGGGVYARRLWGKFQLVGISSAITIKEAGFQSFPVPHLGYAVPVDPINKILKK